MKILLVSGVYPPRIGGPSRQTQHIAKSLIERGVEAHVVTYGERRFSGLLDGVPVTFLDGQPYSHWTDKVLRNIQVYRDLNQVIQAFQPTVIHMQAAAGNLAIVTGVLAKQHQIPALVKYTADLVWERSHEHKLAIAAEPSPPHLLKTLSTFLLELMERFLFSLYDCIWATTPIFKDRLIHRFHVTLKKIVLIPNFIDLQPFQQIEAQRLLHTRQVVPACSRSTLIADIPHTKEWILLTVTRLRPWKGVDQCIEAMAQLTDLSLRLKIVGDGRPDYEQYLQQLAQQLGVSDRIDFVGAIPPEQIAEVYRTADLFVLASQYEPFGIVLLEAMAAGVPIIASHVDGIPAVVEDGISAQLVPPGDAHSLATAIRTLIMNEDRRLALSTAASQRVKNFDLDHGIDTLLASYQSLLN